MKNVVVIGGSYVGMMVAQELARTLPEDSRVIVVEKNSHFSHLFAYPRFSVVPSYEHKAFLPFSTMLLPSSVPPRLCPHLILSSTTALSISQNPRSIILVDSITGTESKLEYEILILATGTTTSKVSLQTGLLHKEGEGTESRGITKLEGINHLRTLQRDLRDAQRIVILGGGAVGVQMACDLATLYPPSTTGKSIILLHSHETLMNRFHPLLSDTIKARFRELGIKTVLGSRAKVLTTESDHERHRRTGSDIEVETEDGIKISADYLIRSTGHAPNSQLLASFAPSAIDSHGFISVDNQLRVVPKDFLEKKRLDGRVFAIGDVAATGAQKAARPALQHSQVLARNIVKYISGESVNSSPFESIAVTPAAIHLTLGFSRSIVFRDPPKDPETGEYLGEPVVTRKEDGREDMGIELVWDKRLGTRKRGECEYHL